MAIAGRAFGAAGDRINPVLVKEIRQALRGRYFKITFAFTLVAATLIGLFVILAQVAEGSSGSGRNFFLAIYACLAVAVLGFVPLSAFLSMGAEWEEGTYDLLVLSDLKPRRIVRGKYLAAAIQTLLHFSTFGPFLVFSFFLREIDLFAVGTILGGTLALSLTLSLFALGVSSLTRIRFLRAVLTILLAVSLVILAGLSIGMAANFTFRPYTLRSTDFPATAGVFLTILAGVAAFAHAVACARLAHPEENRSTGARALTATAVLLGLSWLTFFFVRTRGVNRLEGMTILLLFALVVPMLFFVTEPDELGRRVRPRVPRRGALALLAAPFLPGGARGLLLFLVLAAVVMGGAEAISASRSAMRSLPHGPILGALCYAFLYLSIPSLLGRRAAHTAKGRTIARLGVPVLVTVPILVPTLVGFFVGNRRWIEFEHIGFPIWTLERLDRGDEGPLVFLGSAALLLAALNLPRLVAGVREVLEASRDRRAGRARTAEAALPPAEETGAVAEP